MRGIDRWAVAVRRPDASIWIECHPVSDLPERRRWLKWPLIRGCYALVDSLTIGMKALNIAADKAADDDEPQMSSTASSISMALALVLFVGVFIFLPSAGTKGIDRLVGDVMGDGVWFHIVESFVRIAIFLAYLGAIGLMGDIRRVFQYHGAEHKTIAAWEDGERLDPAVVDRYSTLHVRCGTNFLILVMLLAIVVYTAGGLLVPPPEGITWYAAVGYHVVLRIVLLPVVAGLAYEGLRVGARYDNALVRGIMKPGLWLQLITTRPPDHDQIEVAIRSFEAVVPKDERDGRAARGLPSAVETAGHGLPVELADARATTTPHIDGAGGDDTTRTRDATSDERRDGA